MKKGFKGIFIALILVTLALSVAACGGGKNSHTHTFGDWTATVVATCNAAGEKERICSGCNEKETEAIPADISLHKLPTEFTIDKLATCIAEGSMSKTCSVCNTKAEVTKIEKLPHTLPTEFTIDKPATCIEEGSMSKTCSVCNTKAEVTAIAMLPHTLGEFNIDKPATCIAEGSKSKTCSVCKTKAEVTEIAKISHIYDFSSTVDIEPTCTTVGSESKHCSQQGCDAKKEITEIAVRGHSYSTFITIDVEATCINKGLQSRHCQRKDCDSKIEIVETPKNANKHMGETKEEITHIPTCTTKGYKTVVCLDCNNQIEKNISIPMDPNKHGVVDISTAKIAYCDEEGLSVGTCRPCGKEASRTVIPVNPNEHKIEGTEYKIQKEPNCVADGYKDRGCLHCGKRFGHSGEGLDRDFEKHVWMKDFATDIYPTCIAEGSKSIHCEFGHKHSDGYTKKDVTVIPMDPHYVQDAKYEFITDDDANKYQHFKVCKGCKDNITDNCTMTTKATTTPSESEAGYNTKVCSVCRHSRDIIYAISRNKDYTITKSGDSYVVKNKYHTVLKSGTLAQAIEGLEAHRGLVRDENTDCTIHLAESETNNDGFFNITDGAIELTNGNYTLTGKVRGQVGSIEKGLITVKSIDGVSWENFAHVTLRDMTIEATCFEGTEGGAVYVEKGKLSVYNSTITSDSRHENKTSGVITMISQGVLNIYDGSIIKNTFIDDNTEDSYTPKTFAISMSEKESSKFEVNILGGQIESKQRFSIAGHNVKFTMSGGEVKNVNGPAAVFIKGNSLLNITGGNISGGVHVNNGNADATHIVRDCTITAWAEAINVSGKGTLDISQSSGKTTLLQSSGSSVTAGATVGGTVSINEEAALNMTGGTIQNTNGVALYIRSHAMAYNIGYSQENKTTPQIINNSSDFSTIYLFDYNGTQTSGGTLTIHGAVIKNSNTEKGYAIESRNTGYNINIQSSEGKITTIESKPGRFGVIYMNNGWGTLKVDSATVITRPGTEGYDIYSENDVATIHAPYHKIGGEYILG